MNASKIHDPELYAKMSVPHTDRQTATKALASFFEEVQAARIAHRIPEILLIGAAHYIDGQESRCPHESVAHSLSLGNSNSAPELATALFVEHAKPLLERADMLRRRALPAEAKTGIERALEHLGDVTSERD